MPDNEFTEVDRGPASNEAFVSVSDEHLYFNATTWTEAFPDDPEAVKFAVNEDGHRIAVFPADRDDANAYPVSHPSGGKGAHVSASRALRRAGLPSGQPDGSRRISPQYEESGREIIVDVSELVDDLKAV